MRARWNRVLSGIGLTVGFLCSFNLLQARAPVYAGLIDVYSYTHFMVSMDGGATWGKRVTPGGEILEIHAITPDSVTPENVYICQGSGIYLSTDYGSTWSNNLFPYNNISWVHDVEIDPSHPEWLWATTTVWPLSNLHDTVGVFLSTNSGNTWEHAGEGIPYSSELCVDVLCIAIGSGAPPVAYVGTGEAIGDSTIGVYKRDISNPSARWQYIGLYCSPLGLDRVDL